MKYIIPLIPPSNNNFIGRTNRWEYQETKKQWCNYIVLFCKPKPDNPIEKSIVHIKYFFKNKTRRDPDNYSGKFILDGLVRNGIIKDDNFNCISLQLSSDVDKISPRTEIEITEVKNESNS